MEDLRRGQQGQSLIIMLVALTALFAFAAFAIDVGTWYQKHHQAQVAADSAALAAANCLATAKCTSTASGGDASNLASSYASTNGVPATSVSIGGGYVTVTTATAAPSRFAGLFHVSATPGARAVASYNAAILPASIYGADCSSPTNPPGASCSVNCATAGVSITASGSTSISGAIETNGSYYIDIKGNTTLGGVEYGDGGAASCATSNQLKQTPNTSIGAGPPQEATTFLPYPDTYSDVWSSSTSNECSPSSSYTSGYPTTGSGSVKATGGSSTIPDSVTFSGPNGKGNNTTFGDASHPVIVCANNITLSGNSITLNDVTLVGNISLSGTNSFTISADPSATPDATSDGGTGAGPAVALYETGSALNFGNNNINVTGAVYAPLGAVTVGGNNGGSSLIEGNTVTINGNNSADGPQQTLPGGGTDNLTQ